MIHGEGEHIHLKTKQNKEMQPEMSKFQRINRFGII